MFNGVVNIMIMILFVMEYQVGCVWLIYIPIINFLAAIYPNYY